MNDKNIEDILRESWSPEPPEGMRERVLGRAQSQPMLQMFRSRPQWFTWRFALIAAGLALILITNVVDRGTQTRLAQITGQPSLTESRMIARRPCTLGNWRTDMRDLLAENLTRGAEGNKGDNTP